MNVSPDRLTPNPNPTKSANPSTQSIGTIVADEMKVSAAKTAKALDQLGEFVGRFRGPQKTGSGTTPPAPKGQIDDAEAAQQLSDLDLAPWDDGALDQYDAIILLDVQPLMRSSPRVNSPMGISSPCCPMG